MGRKKGGDFFSRWGRREQRERDGQDQPEENKEKEVIVFLGKHGGSRQVHLRPSPQIAPFSVSRLYRTSCCSDSSSTSQFHQICLNFIAPVSDLLASAEVKSVSAYLCW